MANRRQVLIGAAGLVAAAAPVVSRAAAPFATTPDAGDFIYDYIFVDAAPGAGQVHQKAFIASLPEAAAAVRAAGGEALGYLTPLIGWTSQQLALVLRWKNGAAGREDVVKLLTTHPAVQTVERSRLAATVRPAPSDLPLTRGIYTLRWFEVKTADVPEFIALSEKAWPYFENEFPSRVFGLFRAAQTRDEARRGVTRMLLNTQYDSHAVWEASRRPSSEPTELFSRRNDLTLTTRVASLRFNPLG